MNPIVTQLHVLQEDCSWESLLFIRLSKRPPLGTSLLKSSASLSSDLLLNFSFEVKRS